MARASCMMRLGGTSLILRSGPAYHSRFENSEPGAEKPGISRRTDTENAQLRLGGPPWAKSPALFPNPTSRNRERRWIANALREEWNRAARAVGVKVRMYEGTKHSSASRWHSSGMPLELVRRMLRHRDTRSTERYAKLADSALVEAFAAHHARRGDRRRTRERAQGVLKGRRGTRKAQRNRAPMAGRTGLEPATSGVTGQCSNQLNYRPARDSRFSRPGGRTPAQGRRPRGFRAWISPLPSWAPGRPGPRPASGWLASASSAPCRRPP